MKHQTIEIVAVAYQRFGELMVFVQSILNQSKKNWRLTVIHDGPSEEFNSIMERYKNQEPELISYCSTSSRYNDYGHSLRSIGIQRATSEYLLLTNADNYFIPRALEYLGQAVECSGADVVMYDMVHSHRSPGRRLLPEYSYFKTVYERGGIDISAAIVKTSIARGVGFRDRTHDGDATYFEDVARSVSPAALNVVKINRVLFVHN
jgi:glycosyltransferase involved in cell wall biosynthesis